MSVENPMVGERIAGHPCDVRIGSNRIVRSSTGEVTVMFGYYSKEQETAARFFGDEIVKQLKELQGQASC